MFQEACEEAERFLMIWPQKSQKVNFTSFYWLKLIKPGIAAQIQGRGIRLHFLFGEGKNLQPSLIYYGDSITRKPFREDKLAVMFRKDQRLKGCNMNSGFWKVLMEERK